MTRLHKSFTARSASALVVLSLATGVSACASSKAPSSGGTTASTPNFSGTYKIMELSSHTLGAGSVATFAQPESLVGAKAAANQINAAGGVNGKSFTVIGCDTQGTLNGVAACAKQAVSEGVLAVVGDGDTTGSTAIATLAAAGIPMLGNSPVGLDATNPYSFTFSGGGVSLLAGQVSTAASRGASSVSIVLNSSAFVSQVPALLKPVNAHYPSVNTPIVTVPATAVDLSAVVGQAAKSAAIGLNLGSQDSLASFLSSYSQSGSKTPIYSNNFSVTQNTINKLGNLVEGMYIVSDELPPGDTADPKMADYVKWMNSVDPKAVQDTASLHSYDGVTLVAQAIAGMADATSKQLYAKLNTMTNVHLAGLPTLQFTTPSSELKVFPRVFNIAVVLLQVKNGKLAPVSGQFVDPFTGASISGQN